jgi:hypothetical protein
VNFGDKRLNARFRALAQALADQPLDPINQACGESRAEQKAAYRFFSNERTTERSILQAHQRQTAERALSQSRWVLAVQDTSFLNYSSHLKTEGLGKIANYLDGRNKAKGLVLHTTLALDAEKGVPLGMLDQQIWARPLRPLQGIQKRRWQIPIEEKESHKWIRGLEASVTTLFPSNTRAKPRLVSIADREADIFEFMERARELDTHFVIRSQKSRDRTLIPDQGPLFRRKGGAWLKLRDFLSKQPIQGLMQVEVPRRAGGHVQPEVPARTVDVEIRFSLVTLSLPRRTSIRLRRSKADQQKKYLRNLSRKKSMQISVIWVHERNPLPGTAGLDWVLLTDLPVQTVEQAQEKIKWYSFRWRIESFHKVLKSGLRVEACRLESAGRLKKYITLSSVIAWKILWATLSHRQDPDQTCQTLLSEAEWKALYCRIHRTRTPPRKPPPLKEVIFWIARLGGYTGTHASRKNRKPGTVVLWRGMQRLNDITETWQILSAD